MTLKTTAIAIRLITICHNQTYRISLRVPCRYNSTNKEESLESHRKAMMAKGLPKRNPIDGVSNVILVASGKGKLTYQTGSTNPHLPAQSMSTI